MKILITGASGDLGQALCKVTKDRDVLAIYLTREGRVKHIRADRAVKIDLSDRDAVRTLLLDYQPDLIIHAATIDRPPDAQAKVVAMARNLLECSRPLTRLVNISTDLIFDGLRPPYHDDSPPATPQFSDYSRGKAEVETILKEFPHVLTIRTSLIYGFERDNKQVAWMLDKIDKGEKVRLFYDEYRSAIWSENLAEAVLELAENDVSGAFNVAGPARMSRLELGQGLLKALYYDPDPIIESASQAGSGRPPDLTLDVSRAQSLLKTRLLSFDEALGLAKY